MERTIDLTGWDIHRNVETEWSPWGSGGKARAKMLGNADGYLVMLVEAEPGYEGDRHEHEHAEFFYLVEGTVRNQGRELSAGDGYAAAAGSTHTDFTTETGATYVVIFRI
jgi:quercetin dioxygenase-like cupin family protein